ncbi:transposase [Salipiger manganoxidans]|uniref:IS66 family insertion sequence element accessory protein TnpB n=1 Tax=Salipiger marinus TaxID=555512 RepID=UPI00315BE27E|nr:transposase [Salipiger manganoxidans]
MASDAQTADETDALPPLAPALRRVRLHSLARYKRLERGRFPWPNTSSGAVRLTSAQLAMLWEGIDWRRPDWGAPPARVG